MSAKSARRLGTARAPDWIGDDAKAIWLRLAPVVPDDKLTRETADAFAQLCVALATYEEAHGIVLETGLLIAQGNELAQSPAYPIRSHQGQVALTWLRMFGLTPEQPPTKPGRGGYRPHLVE